MFFLGLRLPFHPLGGVKITTRRSRLRASEHAQRCHLILQFILFRLIGRAEWSDVACVGCYSFWHYDPSEPSGRFGCVSKAVPEVPCIPLRSVKGIFLSFFLSFFVQIFFGKASMILKIHLQTCLFSNSGVHVEGMLVCNTLRLEASKDLQNEVEDLQSLGWKLIVWRCLR